MGLLVGGGWTVDWVILSITLTMLVGYWLRKRSKYFEEHGFPYVPMSQSFVPTLKSFTFRHSFIDFLHDIYNRLEGHKVGGYFQFAQPIIVIRDPELVNKILIKDFSHFHDHGFNVDTEVNPLEGHLFNMEGQQWRALRNKLTPAFTSGKLRGMLPEMSRFADKLVTLMMEKGPEEDVLLKEPVSRFSLDVIGSCAFGMDLGALKNPDNEFKRMAEKFFRPRGMNFVRVMFRSVFPNLTRRLKLKVQDTDVNDFFIGITRQTFEHRMKTGERRNDFMDLLLQLKLKGTVDCDPKDLAEDQEDEGLQYNHQEVEPEKLVLTDGLLAAQSFIFLIAGLENIAVSIALVLFLLSRHQDAQEKARQEVKRVAEKHRGHFSYDALKEMVYLECCITEALRLYPPAVGLFHHCTKDYLLEDGQTIKKGTTVIIPSYSMQRDPQYFQDPDEFLPERFLDDHNVPSNVYLPFGAGPRVCIARRLVLLEVKIAVAKVLEKMRLLHSPKVMEPVRVAPLFFSFDIQGGMWARLEPLVK